MLIDSLGVTVIWEVKNATLFISYSVILLQLN